MIFELIAVCAIAIGIAIVATPMVRHYALRFGLVDRPDGRRKIHRETIALGGGIAVFFAAFSAIVCAYGLIDVRHDFHKHGSPLTGLAIASALIVGIGIIDDYGKLRGRGKCLWQLAAISIVMASGTLIKDVHLFEWRISLGIFSLPFTAFLLLGAVNSLNLLDGMDGLLSSVGAVIFLGMAGMAVYAGSPAAACVAAAMAGALLGFLRFNYPPAVMFLGDSGSMLIGLVVGTLAIQSSLKGPAAVALAAPLAVLTIPVFDTFAAILRRKLTGRSVYSTDRGHIHHCFLRKGYSVPKALAIFALLGGITLAGALASLAFNNDLLAFFSAALVIAILTLTKLFGYSELVLLKRRLAAFLPRFLRGGECEENRFEIHLQGSAKWSELWRKILRMAEENAVYDVVLNVNAPAIHESYLAQWRRSGYVEEDPELWSLRRPLVTSGVVIGHIEIIGRRIDGDIATTIAAFDMVSSNIVADEFSEEELAPVLRQFEPVDQREPIAVGAIRLNATSEELPSISGDMEASIADESDSERLQRKPR